MDSPEDQQRFNIRIKLTDCFESRIDDINYDFSLKIEI